MPFRAAGRPPSGSASTFCLSPMHHRPSPALPTTPIVIANDRVMFRLVSSQEAITPGSFGGLPMDSPGSSIGSFLEEFDLGAGRLATAGLRFSKGRGRGGARVAPRQLGCGECAGQCASAREELPMSVSSLFSPYTNIWLSRSSSRLVGIRDRSYTIGRFPYDCPVFAPWCRYEPQVAHVDMALYVLKVDLFTGR
ncbi:hypothetical protein BJ912DRAFT_951288 [Pholiota molesta]|nr:hypothetical protein BJ912DRAFT_951288 [Pholiota molesta]